MPASFLPPNPPPPVRTRFQARAVVAGSNPWLRAGLADVLRERGNVEVVAAVALPRQLIAACREHLPDLAFMAVSRTEPAGFRICRQLRLRLPQLRCVLLTAEGGREVARQARLAGAAAWGEENAPVAHWHQVLDQLQAPSAPAPAAPVASGLKEQLTARELEVLQLLAAHQSNRAIGGQLGLAQATIKNYVSHIYRKLRVSYRADAADAYVAWQAAPVAAAPDGARAPGRECSLWTLTAQERRIVALVAEGWTNEQIGAELHLARTTVKNYLVDIFVKLRITRRAHAAALFAAQPGRAGPAAAGAGRRLGAA